MPRGQGRGVPKAIIIELVPPGVQRNASCKGCRLELGTCAYRYKPTKAASWHPWCYEDKHDFLASYVSGATGLNTVNLDIEARERIEQWADDLRAVKTADATSDVVEHDATAGTVGSSSEITTGARPAGETTQEVAAGQKRGREDDGYDIAEPASKQVKAEDGTPYKFSYAAERVAARGERDDESGLRGPKEVNPLSFITAVHTSDTPVHVPAYPARICDILREMEKKARTIGGLAAMKMFMR